MIAPVRWWQMGREEEIAYAREHGIPVKGGTEVGAVLDRRQPVGALVGGRAGSRTSTHAPEDDVFQLVTRPEEAPDEPEDGRRSSSSAGVPVALNGERLGLVELLERAAEIGCTPRRRDRRPHRGPHRRPEGARHLRGARPRRSCCTAHEELEKLVGTIHQNQFKPAARPAVGLPRLRGPVVGAAAHRPRRLHGRGQRAGDRRRSGSSSTRASARVVTRESPNAVYDAQLGDLRRVGRAVLAAGLARASSSCGRCSRAWPGGVRHEEDG